MTRRPFTIAAAAVLALTLDLAVASAQQDASPAGAAVSPQAGVVVLTVEDASRFYVRQLTDAFVRAVRSGADSPAVYFDALDSPRFEGSAHLEGLREWLRRKYAGKRIDLVVALGEDALAFLAGQHGEPWPDTPVLFVETGGVRIDITRDLPRAGGVILEDPFPDALATLKTILPATRRVVLAYGASSVDRARMEGFADKVRAANLGLEPVVWAGLTPEELEKALAQPLDDTAVFLLAPNVDASGRDVAAGHLCERLVAATKAPLFSRLSEDMGCGIVGGVLLDLSLIGELAGRAALSRLARPSTEVTRIRVAEFTRLAFDARQLRRWGIPESRLPAGSAVLFRAPSVWRDYRGLVIAAIVVTLTQALLIAGLVLERRRRHRAELAERRHLAAMAHLDRRSALGELAASLAHELNQPLNSILQNAGAAQMMLASPDGPPATGELVEILEDIQKEDTRAGDVIRGMRALLQKSELDAKPTDPYLFVGETVDLVRPDASARGIRIEADLADNLTPIQADRVHLQQVLLNLLMNAMDAVAELPPDRRRVRVQARPNGPNVEVSVTDRGPGIAMDPPERIFEAFYTTKATGLGMGLSISRTIVEAHHGEMGARNEPAGGATVWFRIPAAKDR